MKKPLVSTRLRLTARALPGGRLVVMTELCPCVAVWIAVLSLLGAACASGDAPLSDAAQPSTPGQAQPGTVFGLPGDGSEGTPTSMPPVNDGPGATETNFLTPPCGADGSRLIPDGGGASDAGDFQDGVSSGGPRDAGRLDAGAAGSSAADAGTPDADGARVPCSTLP